MLPRISGEAGGSCRCHVVKGKSRRQWALVQARSQQRQDLRCRASACGERSWQQHTKRANQPEVDCEDVVHCTDARTNTRELQLSRSANNSCMHHLLKDKVASPIAASLPFLTWHSEVQMTNGTKWQLTGDYFENCNCDVVCPCLVSRSPPLTAKPTQGECDVAIAFHIETGSYGQVSLDG